MVHGHRGFFAPKLATETRTRPIPNGEGAASSLMMWMLRKPFCLLHSKPSFPLHPF